MDARQEKEKAGRCAGKAGRTTRSNPGWSTGLSLNPWFPAVGAAPASYPSPSLSLVRGTKEARWAAQRPHPVAPGAARSARALPVKMSLLAAPKSVRHNLSFGQR